MVAQERLGAVYAYARRPRRARFNQLAFVRTVRDWRADGRFDAVERAASDDPALVFDVSWRRTGVGPNGYPNGFELTYSLDADHVAPEAETDPLDEFGVALVDALYGAVESDCPPSLSVLEYGVLVATRTASEAAVADAFGLDVDAVRGTLAAAEANVEADGRFAASLDRFEACEDASFALTTPLVERVAESELPVAPDEEGYVSYAPDG